MDGIRHLHIAIVIVVDVPGGHGLAEYAMTDNGGLKLLGFQSP